MVPPFNAFTGRLFASFLSFIDWDNLLSRILRRSKTLGSMDCPFQSLCRSFVRHCHLLSSVCALDHLNSVINRDLESGLSWNSANSLTLRAHILSFSCLLCFHFLLIVGRFFFCKCFSNCVALLQSPFCAFALHFTLL